MKATIVARICAVIFIAMAIVGCAPGADGESVQIQYSEDNIEWHDTLESMKLIDSTERRQTKIIRERE